MRHHSIMQTLAYAHLCPEDNQTGPEGIDFHGKRDVAVLDCFQNYPAILTPEPIHALSGVPQVVGVDIPVDMAV
jgi:hypothetical protein